ncbi:MAG: albusnodin family lasso peptide [Sciscionella sp.]
MAHQDDAGKEAVRTDEDAPPAVIELGNAATLTRGGQDKSTEAKQTPYD